MTAPSYFGRYRVLKAHASGQMGTIFVAEDPLIGRKVAIKGLRLDEASSAADQERLHGRFERETRIAGTFSHPNIVTIFDFGRQDGRPFIVMEFIDGRSLRQLLDDRAPLEAAEVARVMRSICAALDYAHDRGVVHRDLKPSNVMLADAGSEAGVPKVTDFGVAHLAGSDLTMSGKVFGAPSYMSPEQIRDEELTGASDQFAAGVIAYEMLTNRRPFAGAAAAQTIFQVVHNQPRAPRRHNPEIPPEAAEAVLRALDKDPERRFPSCGAFAAALCGPLEEPPATGFELQAFSTGGPDVETAARTSWAERFRDGTERLPGGGALVLAVGVWGLALLAAWGLTAQGGLSGTDDGTTPVSSWHDEPAPDSTSEPSRGSASRTGAGEPAATAPGATTGSGDPGPLGSDPTGGPDRTADGLSLPLDLTVRSRPAGARVILDGEPLERSSPVPIRVTDGALHVLRLELDGYRPVSWRFRVDDLDERHLDGRELFFPMATVDAVEAGPAADAAAEQPDGMDGGGVRAQARPREPAPPTLVGPTEVRRLRAPQEVEAPRKLSHVPVELPDGLSVGGTVVVELEINWRGEVIQARLLNSLDPAVDRAILDTVVRWRYAPTRADGQAVNVLVTTTVRVGSTP